MSTAGKVLSALAAVMAFVWVLLASAVTQLNRNGAEAIQKFEKQVEDLDKQVAQVRRELNVLVDQAYQARMRSQSELTVLEARQAGVEKDLSLVRETAERVKFQLQREQATAKAAEADSKQRQAELEAETKAKADAEALVQKLKAENAETLGRLQHLRDEFTAALKENRAMVERLERQGGGRTSRRASFIR